MKAHFFYSLLIAPLIFSFQRVLPIQNLPEKPIVIVIPSYNNKDWYIKNLESVLSQKYSNYSVLYTDDSSPDGTGELVAEYIKEYDTEKKISLIQNTKRLGALNNLYKMIHQCDDNAIIVTLDGDDWLADENVLSKLNEVYSSDNIWLTYGQFKMYPSNTIGWATAMPDEIIENNSFREYPHLPTHLRTFYAWLFKAIQLEDLFYFGDFYQMTWDMAMMFPMIEMAGAHHRFISDVLYIYNDANSISDHRIGRQLQAHLAQRIRAKQQYTPLIAKKKKRTISTPETTVILFAKGTYDSIVYSIHNLQKQLNGITKIAVLYSYIGDSPENFSDLEQYDNVTIHYVNSGTFRSHLISACNSITTPYVLFTNNNYEFTKKINLKQCVSVLEETNANGFYFNLSDIAELTQKAPRLPLPYISDTICCWHFASAKGVWSQANSVNMVLYRSNASFMNWITAHYGQSPDGFEMTWANEGKLDRIGLCFINPCTKKVQK